jgi:hypothetical protein
MKAMLSVNALFFLSSLATVSFPGTRIHGVNQELWAQNNNFYKFRLLFCIVFQFNFAITQSLFLDYRENADTFRRGMF